jgi:hypothetical protein
VRLDARSRKLLASPSAADAVLLGILRGDHSISLFLAGPEINRRRAVYPGHQALMDEGLISPGPARGFSFELRGRKVRRFYRNSILNSHLPLCCISAEEMASIIEACGLVVADDFESYP